MGEMAILRAEVERLQAAIRKHMNMRGDDRCHSDDHDLYDAVLPEGDTRPARDTAVTLENCARFIRCRQQGLEYVSPERELERLRRMETAYAALYVTAKAVILTHSYIPERHGILSHGLRTTIRSMHDLLERLPLPESAVPLPKPSDRGTIHHES